MALAKKQIKKEETCVCSCTCESKIETLVAIIDSLVDRVSELEKKRSGKASIHKIEDFSGDVETPVEEYSGMRMKYEDKLISMQNAIAILPPNLMVNDKHTPENIGAICGFLVTDDMYDELYKEDI